MCYTILEVFDLGQSFRSLEANGIIHSHDDLGGTWFDQDEVIRRLRETFNSIEFGADDPLVQEAERAEEFFAQQGGATNPVVTSLRKKAKVYGPALPFSFSTEQGAIVKGLVRRYDIRFTYPASTSAETRQRITELLRSFAIGEVEEWPCSD